MTQSTFSHTTSGMETPPAPKAMASPDLAVNLIYTVLCLVPGFISLQIVTHNAHLDTDMSDFEKSTWCLIGSGRLHIKRALVGRSLVVPSA